MERLISPVDDGGAPYLNQDFFQFLQQNHIDCYSSFLDQINDTNTGNCGIILKLPENHIYEVMTFSTIDRDGAVLIDYRLDQRFTYNLVDSLIYLDGEFLEPAPWIATQSAFRVDGSLPIYLVKIETEKIRRYTKVYDFLETVIETKYFDIVIEKPDTNHIEILTTQDYLYPVQKDPSLKIPSAAPSGYSMPPPPPILPFLNAQFTFNGIGFGIEPLSSARHFSRVLKYYLADEDEIFMTHDLRFFNRWGLGFGPKFGFRLILDDVEYDYRYDEFIEYSKYLDEKGNNLPNGRFFIGYATGSNNLPTHLTLDRKLTKIQKNSYTNYGKPKNVGGEEYHQLQADCLPPHGHSFSGTPSNQMEHTHFVPTADILQFTDNTPDPGDWWNILRLTKGSAIPQWSRFKNYNLGARPIEPTYNKYFSYKLIDTMDPTTLYEVDGNGNRTENTKNIADHTHPINDKPSENWTGSPIPPLQNKHNNVHYNTPPYAVVGYYKKWNPYKPYKDQF